MDDGKKVKCIYLLSIYVSKSEEVSLLQMHFALRHTNWAWRFQRGKNWGTCIQEATLEISKSKTVSLCVWLLKHCLFSSWKRYGSRAWCVWRGGVGDVRGEMSLPACSPPLIFIVHEQPNKSLSRECFTILVFVLLCDPITKSAIFNHRCQKYAVPHRAAASA